MKKTSLLLIPLLTAVFGCQQYSTPPNPVSRTTLPSQVASSNAKLLPVPPSGHFYLYEKNGEYAYPRYTEENVSNVSAGENKLFKVRYLGQQNGQYTVLIDPKNEISVRLSCHSDCSKLKKENIISEQLFGTETISASGTIEETIMQDAKAGRLKVYDAG